MHYHHLTSFALFVVDIVECINVVVPNEASIEQLKVVSHLGEGSSDLHPHRSVPLVILPYDKPLCGFVVGSA